MRWGGMVEMGGRGEWWIMVWYNKKSAHRKEINRQSSASLLDQRADALHAHIPHIPSHIRLPRAGAQSEAHPAHTPHGVHGRRVLELVRVIRRVRRGRGVALLALVMLLLLLGVLLLLLLLLGMLRVLLGVVRVSVLRVVRARRVAAPRTPVHASSNHRPPPRVRRRHNPLLDRRQDRGRGVEPPKRAPADTPTVAAAHRVQAATAHRAHAAPHAPAHAAPHAQIVLHQPVLVYAPAVGEPEGPVVQVDPDGVILERRGRRVGRRCRVRRG